MAGMAGTLTERVEVYTIIHRNRPSKYTRNHAVSTIPNGERLTAVQPPHV